MQRTGGFLGEHVAKILIELIICCSEKQSIIMDVKEREITCLIVIMIVIDILD